jgi:hypothetical protein
LLDVVVDSITTDNHDNPPECAITAVTSTDVVETTACCTDDDQTSSIIDDGSSRSSVLDVVDDSITTVNHNPPECTITTVAGSDVVETTVCCTVDMTSENGSSQQDDELEAADEVGNRLTRIGTKFYTDIAGRMNRNKTKARFEAQLAEEGNRGKMIFVSKDNKTAIFDGIRAGTVMSHNNSSRIVHQNYARGYLLLFQDSDDKNATLTKISEYDRFSVEDPYMEASRMNLDIIIMVIGFTAHMTGEYMIHFWCSQRKCFMRALCQSFFKRLNSDKKMMYSLHDKGNEDSLTNVDLQGYFRSSENVLVDESPFFLKAMVSPRNEMIASQRARRMEQKREQEAAEAAAVAEEKERKRLEKLEKNRVAKAEKRRIDKEKYNAAATAALKTPILPAAVSRLAAVPSSNDDQHLLRLKEQLRKQKTELEDKQQLILKQQYQLQEQPHQQQPSQTLPQELEQQQRNQQSQPQQQQQQREGYQRHQHQHTPLKSQQHGPYGGQEHEQQQYSSSSMQNKLQQPCQQQQQPYMYQPWYHQQQQQFAAPIQQQQHHQPIMQQQLWGQQQQQQYHQQQPMMMQQQQPMMMQQQPRQRLVSDNDIRMFGKNSAQIDRIAALEKELDFEKFMNNGN